MERQIGNCLHKAARDAGKFHPVPNKLIQMFSTGLGRLALDAVAAYLTRRTGSLLPAIGIHAAHNLGVLFLDLYA